MFLYKLLVILSPLYDLTGYVREVHVMFTGVRTCICKIGK